MPHARVSAVAIIDHRSFRLNLDAGSIPGASTKSRASLEIHAPIDSLAHYAGAVPVNGLSGRLVNLEELRNAHREAGQDVLTVERVVRSENARCEGRAEDLYRFPDGVDDPDETGAGRKVV